MSEIRVDSIKNRAGTGSPAFSGNITADGFVASGGGSGFLKADGTIDTNTYLSQVAVGDGVITFAANGNGLSLSASPTFNVNQDSAKTITFTLSSDTAASANSICRRTASGDLTVRNLNVVDVLATDDVIADGAIASKGGSFFYNTSMVNNPLTLTGYYQSRALQTDVSATFATGINIATASNNEYSAALEFYKTRRSGTLSGARVSAAARDAIMGLHASADDGTEDQLLGSIYASVTGTESLSSSTNKACFFQFVYKADDSFGPTVPYREWVTIGEALNSTDAVGPTTIRIPFAASGSQSSNCSFDDQGRLVKQSSTRAIKTNIEDLDRSYAYNILNNLRPVWYRSIAPADNPEWGYYGAIAEEVAEVDPRLAIWGYADDQYEFVTSEDGSSHRELRTTAQLSPQGVQYDRLATILFTIVKDQQTAITDLESKVRALESAAE